MTDPKHELLRQIAELRRRMSPEVLERLRRATEPVALPPAPAGKDSYDKEAARAAVNQFLASRNDGGRFKQRLAQALRRPDGKPH